MICLEDVRLRALEPKDVESLYVFRNDWNVIQHLGGFSVGYSKIDLEEWIKRHSNRNDEVIWCIAEQSSDQCIGHVGLYKIDYRVRKAEFAIVIGYPNRWGQGLGRKITKAVVDWAFAQLNMNKIGLSVVATNFHAIHLYESLGFICEGILRDEQFRGGHYSDVILMATFARSWNISVQI